MKKQIKKLKNRLNLFFNGEPDIKQPNPGKKFTFFACDDFEKVQVLPVSNELTIIEVYEGQHKFLEKETLYIEILNPFELLNINKIKKDNIIVSSGKVAISSITKEQSKHYQLNGFTRFKANGLM